MKLHMPKIFPLVGEWRCIGGVASLPLFGGVGKGMVKMFYWSNKRPQSLQ
jgi:hypothetical protein